MAFLARFTGLALVLALAGSAAAQLPFPLPGEPNPDMNKRAQCTQDYLKSVDQQITALANGGFVVTWHDFSNGVGGAPGLFQQSLGFVDKDGNGVRYADYYDNDYPSPARAGARGTGPAPAPAK